MAAENLKKLHTALVDTRAAYELALNDTDDEDVVRVCKEMISLRHTDHQELHQSLILAGEEPDENGSFMSVVHETVIGVRATLTGISKKTLPAFASGEEYIIEEYDLALREASGDPKMTETLARQKETLFGKDRGDEGAVGVVACPSPAQDLYKREISAFCCALGMIAR